MGQEITKGASIKTMKAKETIKGAAIRTMTIKETTRTGATINHPLPPAHTKEANNIGGNMADNMIINSTNRENNIKPKVESMAEEDNQIMEISIKVSYLETRRPP